MSIDLRGMSKKELLALKSRVEKALERLERQALEQARKAAAEAARKFGFSLDEVAGAETPKPARPRKAAAKPRTKAQPKYANPDDPSQTWTGRGRQPAWFKAAIEAGKSPDDMLIDKG